MDKEDKSTAQQSAPLLEAMRAYIADGAVAFHTPGHKQGKGIPEIFRDIITPAGLRMEVSLMEELDDLHEPTTCIKAAQDLAADLYGADAAYFVINGTTAAIQAMILAAVNPGEKIIIPRNAHRSIVGGIMLSGAQPVFVQPEIDQELGIAMGLSLESIERAMAENPDAKAVLVINPTYYGVASDLKTIAGRVHAKQMLLLVDEAHGPHFKFSAELPLSAMDAGADIAAQSTHKILGSLTQTSMLQARFGRIDPERLRTMLSLVQSTSPNYLLLASLDAARWQMATQGESLIGKAVQLAQKLRQAINTIGGLYCFGEERLHSAGAFALDATKLTVTVSGLGLTGPEAEQILRHEYKIQCELSDRNNVLFILSLADTEKEAALLLGALRQMAAQRGEQAPLAPALSLPAIPQQRLLPRAALFSATEKQAFRQSAGSIAAEVITFYPPGIPIVCPGEIITREIIGYALAMQQIGLKVVGPADASLNTIKVVKQ